MTLRRRIEKLKGGQGERGKIEIYLYDLEEDLVTGANGESMTAEVVKERQKASNIVIDLRRRP